MLEHRGLTESTLDIYQGVLIGVVETIGVITILYTPEQLRDFVLQRARPHGVPRKAWWTTASTAVRRSMPSERCSPNSSTTCRNQGPNRTRPISPPWNGSRCEICGNQASVWQRNRITTRGRPQDERCADATQVASGVAAGGRAMMASRGRCTPEIGRDAAMQRISAMGRKRT